MPLHVDSSQSCAADRAALAELVASTTADLKAPVLLVTDHEPPLASAASDATPASVLVVVADEAVLRRLVTTLPPLPRSRTVAVLVAEAAGVVPLVGRPTWPSLVGLDVRTTPGGSAITVARFAAKVAATEVLAQLARNAAVPVTSGNAGVFTALAPRVVAPPVDVTATAAYDADAKTPAEVWIGGDPSVLPSEPPAETPVLGRAPVVVQATDDLEIGPIDEAVFNPIGFLRETNDKVVDLDADCLATPALVRRLREASGVRISWSTEGPASDRTVATLAMSGIPLVTELVPEESRARLGNPLSDELERPVDLTNPLRREEHSVRLRRAALTDHSTLAWRGRLAARAGVRHASYPSISVLLPTRRPEMLDFALGQIAKQRLSLPGATLEVVVAAHGFTPDPGQIADRLGAHLGVAAHTVLTCEADAMFGDVLRAASDAASGDVVVKMDDDDWYGPDFLTDLLLARRYSGAMLVGMLAELVYLQPIDTTVRRRGTTETFGTFVAGGTTMIDRSVLRTIGGYRRVRVHDDVQLLDAVQAAGGSTYRTQGLGYVLRRTAGGHTWHAGLGYFLTRRTLADQWRGFRPSRLLEHDAWEAPR